MKKTHSQKFVANQEPLAHTQTKSMPQTTITVSHESNDFNSRGRFWLFFIRTLVTCSWCIALCVLWLIPAILTPLDTLFSSVQQNSLILSEVTSAQEQVEQIELDFAYTQLLTYLSLFALGCFGIAFITSIGLFSRSVSYWQYGTSLVCSLLVLFLYGFSPIFLVVAIVGLGVCLIYRISLQKIGFVILRSVLVGLSFVFAVICSAGLYNASLVVHNSFIFAVGIPLIVWWYFSFSSFWAVFYSSLRELFIWQEFLLFCACVAVCTGILVFIPLPYVVLTVCFFVFSINTIQKLFKLKSGEAKNG
jgi:hypothetical protein